MNSSIKASCGLLGITRQSYYQQLRVSKQKAVEHEVVLEMVRRVRKKQKTAGGRLLYHKLKGELSQMEIKLGRDGLFNLLASENMLIRRRKRKIWTTDSNHGHHVPGE